MYYVYKVALLKLSLPSFQMFILLMFVWIVFLNRLYTQICYSFTQINVMQCHANTTLYYMVFVVIWFRLLFYAGVKIPEFLRIWSAHEPCIVRMCLGVCERCLSKNGNDVELKTCSQIGLPSKCNWFIINFVHTHIDRKRTLKRNVKEEHTLKTI